MQSPEANQYASRVSSLCRRVAVILVLSFGLVTVGGGAGAPTVALAQKVKKKSNVNAAGKKRNRLRKKARLRRKQRHKRRRSSKKKKTTSRLGRAAATTSSGASKARGKQKSDNGDRTARKKKGSGFTLPEYYVESSHPWLDGYAYQDPETGVWWTSIHTGPGVRTPIEVTEAQRRYDPEARIKPVDWGDRK